MKFSLLFVVLFTLSSLALGVEGDISLYNDGMLILDAECRNAEGETIRSKNGIFGRKSGPANEWITSQLMWLISSE